MADLGFTDPSGAPIMSGTWVNPKTGHKFVVKDCYFQDGQFMVSTTDGQVLDYNTIQNYIQATDSNGKEMSKGLGNIYNKESDVPPEVASELVEEGVQTQATTPSIAADVAADVAADEQFIYGVHPTRQVPTVTSTQAAPVRDFDTEMIERALGRRSLPELNATLDWPDAPTEQLKILIDTFNIDPAKISEWYINHINMNAVRERCIDILSEALRQQMDSSNMAPPATKEDTKSSEESVSKSKKAATKTKVK